MAWVREMKSWSATTLPVGDKTLSKRYAGSSLLGKKAPSSGDNKQDSLPRNTTSSGQMVVLYSNRCHVFSKRSALYAACTVLYYVLIT